jgi:hypothetical protein
MCNSVYDHDNDDDRDGCDDICNLKMNSSLGVCMVGDAKIYRLVENKSLFSINILAWCLLLLIIYCPLHYIIRYFGTNGFMHFIDVININLLR